MSAILLNLIINLSLTIFAIISIAELIYDNSVNGIIFKKVKNRGWILIAISLISVGFNFLKDYQSDESQNRIENEKRKSDSLLVDSQIKLHQFQISSKDSIIQKVENTYQNSLKASNQALAMYNLKLTDSLHSVVNTLKINALTPQLVFRPLGNGNHPFFIKKDQGRNAFYIQFESRNGTCYHVLLYCYFLNIKNNGFEVLHFDSIASGHGFVTSDSYRTFQTVIKNSILDYPELFVLIIGSFSKDPEGKILVPYSQAIKYNFKDNVLITEVEMDFDEYRKELNIK